MTAAPIVLARGFWLDPGAWDEVTAARRGDGHTVIALTLPGLESVDADHVDAVCDAVPAAGAPLVLAKLNDQGCRRADGEILPAASRCRKRRDPF